MWLGELITQRGIGNGMSLIIFAAVISRMPYQLGNVFTQGSKLQFAVNPAHGGRMIVAIVIVESGQRRIPVQFAKRVVGPPHVRRPEHLHPAEGQPVGRDPGDLRELVAPVPAILAQVTPWNGVKTFIQNNLTPTSGVTWFYIAIYAL